MRIITIIKIFTIRAWAILQNTKLKSSFGSTSSVDSAALENRRLRGNAGMEDKLLCPGEEKCIVSAFPNTALARRFLYNSVGNTKCLLLLLLMFSSSSSTRDEFDDESVAFSGDDMNECSRNCRTALMLIAMSN
jgi:hypothetical protein